MVFLDDNIGGGTVATVTTTGQIPEYMRGAGQYASYDAARKYRTRTTAHLRSAVYKDDNGNRQIMPVRQAHVLLAVFAGKLMGPTAVADRLDMSVSMAYRDLTALVDRGLVSDPSASGHYVTTDLGTHVIREFLREFLSTEDSDDSKPQDEEQLAEYILDLLREHVLARKERIQVRHGVGPPYAPPQGVFPLSSSFRDLKDEDARESQE
jgi:predicted transcriptional regulator